jgi:hypothetical protein
MCWMPIRIRIRQNVAYPTRSGSTTLVILTPAEQGAVDAGPDLALVTDADPGGS